MYLSASGRKPESSSSLRQQILKYIPAALALLILGFSPSVCKEHHTHLFPLIQLRKEDRLISLTVLITANRRQRESHHHHEIMASNLFFDPLVALRATPLVSTTCTLLFAYEQHFFLSLFNRPQTRPETRRFLPAYFTMFFAEGVVQVFGFLGVTAVSSLANLYLHNRGTVLLDEQGAYWWYAAAAGLAVSHLLYTPLVAPPVFAIRGDRPLKQGEDVNTKLDDWLWANKLRMLTTDLGAWMAAVFAVGRTLSA